MCQAEGGLSPADTMMNRRVMSSALGSRGLVGIRNSFALCVREARPGKGEWALEHTPGTPTETSWRRLGRLSWWEQLSSYSLKGKNYQ